MSIASALAAIRAKIPAAVTLVAVSKFHPAEAVSEAIAAGQSVFGENRVQEAEQKFPPLLAAHPQTRLHLIGPLQTNKALQAVRLAHTIETLDRPKLADALATAIQAAGRTPTLLIQINIGDEPQKSGIPTAEADTFIRAMRPRFGAALQGLMCIPPEGRDPTPYFRHLASLAETHGLPTRSMGMSADYEIAIQAGATHIRIGSAIFGARG